MYTVTSVDKFICAMVNLPLQFNPLFENDEKNWPVSDSGQTTLGIWPCAHAHAGESPWALWKPENMGFTSHMPNADGNCSSNAQETAHAQVENSYVHDALQSTSAIK